MKPIIRIKYCDNPKVDYDNFYITEAMKTFCNPVICDEPDILFYSCFSREHTKFKNVVKVFFTEENVHPDFNECDYAISCQPMQYGNRYFQLAGHNRNMDERANDRSHLNINEKTRFCNFIYSNDNPLHDGARLRIEFCELLSKYKPVDCPGRVLHNMDSPELSTRYHMNWVESKVNFIRKYKFTIAWENTYGEGYTTEKLADPLMAGSVPIYWGYVPNYINPKSIINVSDFSNFSELVEYIKYLDNDDNAYREILLSEPLLPSYRFYWKNELAQFLKQIVDSDFALRVKSPVHRDSVTLALQYANNNENLFLHPISFCRRAVRRFIKL